MSTITMNRVERAFRAIPICLVITAATVASLAGLAHTPASFVTRYQKTAFPEFKQLAADEKGNINTEIVKLTFVERLKVYRSHVDAVQTILRYQVLLVTAAFLLIRYQQIVPLNILGLSFTLPRQVLLAVIPIASFWLFYQFGFELDNALGQRAVLYNLAEIIQPTRAPDPSSRQEYELFTIKSLADDASLIDCWLVCSQDDMAKLVSVKNRDASGNILIGIVFSGCMAFYGLAHACVICLILEIMHSAHSKTRTIAVGLLASLLTALLLLSHYVFAYMGGNASWGQLVALFSWAISMFFLNRLADQYRYYTEPKIITDMGSFGLAKDSGR